MRSFLQSTLVFAAVGCTVVGLALLQPLAAVSASSKAKQRGAELFADRGCAHCHGPAGVGGKKGPDLQLVRKRMSKPQMRLQIGQGGMMMPAFGSTLTPPQIEDLIAYLRAKRKVVAVPAKPHESSLNTIATESATN